MRTARLIIAFALASSPHIASFASLPLHAAPPVPAADRGEKPEPAFAWFDKLGYPDVAQKPFIRIATGSWVKSADGPAKNEYHHGFLVDDDPTSFQAFVVDTLQTETFTKTPPKTPEFERVGFDERDLSSHLEQLIGGQRTRPFTAGDPDWPRRFGKRLAERAEFFVLAWAASRRGLQEPAARMYFVVETMAAERPPGDDKPRTTRGTIASDIGHAEMWAAVLLFGEVEVPRTELLKRFQRIAQEFPESEHHRRAVHTAAVLERMVREDEEHARRGNERPLDRRRLDERPTQEQVAEWIFRLRDQNGVQWTDPGTCDIFHTPDDDETSPAHRLVDFGYDAVPQLIDAVGDERFTRSVGFERDFYFSHHGLTVGHCAERILSEIAERRFELAHDPKRTPAEDAAAKKKLIRAWHDSLRTKGEMQTLAEGVARGDENAEQLASQLVAKYPDDAARAIIAGARRTGDAHVRRSLVRMLHRFTGSEVDRFLLAELESTDRLASPPAAAELLHDRGRPEAAAAMIRRWENTVRNAQRKPQDRYSADEDEKELAVFLVTSKRTAAVKAVAEQMHRFPFDLRMETVEACNRSGSVRMRMPSDKIRPDPDYDDALLGLLIRALDDDRERRSGMFLRLHDKQIQDPRVCDLAANVLWQLAPQKYPFDLAADQATRDRARRAIIVAWHQEKNLPLPLKRPHPPPVRVKPD